MWWLSFQQTSWLIVFYCFLKFTKGVSSESPHPTGDDCEVVDVVTFHGAYCYNYAWNSKRKIMLKSFRQSGGLKGGSWRIGYSMPFLEGPLIWISLQLKIHHRVSMLYLPGWLMRILSLSIPAPGHALSSVFVLGEPQLTTRSYGCWSKPGFFFISSTHFGQIVEDFPESCSQKSLCQVISNQGHLITQRAVYVWSGHWIQFC